MTPYRKKLIEVALPLVKINEAAAREKSIRHGHPSTLHLWWARRPLAACRAVLFASLVDDPDSDPMFRAVPELASRKRAELFNLIEELVLWENSNNPRVINQARAEIARCVASRKLETGELKEGDRIGAATVRQVKAMAAGPDDVNAFLAAHAPPVLDPFCGGGSIPLEAQRLGLRAYASDLNPVAVLITKALIEIPPKFAGRPPVNPDWQKKSAAEKATTTWEGAKGLAEDVRYYGRWMRDEAEKRIGHLYPKVKVTKEMAKGRPDLKEYVGEELTVIAWLWARTIASPNPATGGAPIPLVKSFWLSKRKGKQAWINPVIDRHANSIRYEIARGVDGPHPKGTVDRKGAKCLLTGDPIPFDLIRAEGKARRMGFAMIAIAAEGNSERVYLPPISAHEHLATEAKPDWAPDNEMAYNPFSLRPPLYGLNLFSDLFTLRQLTILALLTELADDVRARILADASCIARRGAIDSVGGEFYANAVSLYIAFAVDKLVDLGNTGCLWEPVAQCPRNLFGRQALPMHWSFAEANPFSDSSGSFGVVIKNLYRNLVSVLAHSIPCAPGNVQQADVASLQPGSEQPVVCTDPPYYNNVDYADLSDFFYVWLRRSLRNTFPDLTKTLLTPKEKELVATPYRFNDNKDAAKIYFEGGLRKALLHIRNIHDHSSPFTLFYAFKQAEVDDADDDIAESDPSGGESLVSTGWETMLEAVLNAGFSVSGTWPIRTELNAALKGNMNALASSIVLVCRPRPTDAPLATRKQFITALRQELPDALRNLQQGNIAPVDLAQAAIGPGMAVFTRYAKVMETDGSAMSVRTALGLINQALDEVLAEQEGEFDGDTRWALAWFEQYGSDEGPFGVAETLSKAKVTAVNGLVEAGVITARGGKVRLVPRADLPPDWDPAADRRLTVWEATQHLIRTLEANGEAAAATLLHRLGGLGETCRDLAYRLYTLCERKKWAEEALAYNGLVIAWPELTRLALAERVRPAEAKQGEMF